eukprot:CAMPEP_0198131354 /NCGR_PEP_ID=MMETSP1442-20131203/56016_1 /TAXON_ID= /ORGANISM="Craspedostauros australis, Strain CCMP3328" /LENGTH=172 /DNA_ID=CAMNT_0043792153 /DNA_START=95 /DNA_END=613 /DNA_ORIENTATION=+
MNSTMSDSSSTCAQSPIIIHLPMGQEEQEHEAAAPQLTCSASRKASSSSKMLLGLVLFALVALFGYATMGQQAIHPPPSSSSIATNNSNDADIVSNHLRSAFPSTKRQLDVDGLAFGDPKYEAEYKEKLKNRNIAKEHKAKFEAPSLADASQSQHEHPQYQSTFQEQEVHSQ